MELTLIKNDDQAKINIYRLARAIYAETHAGSLAAVEGLTSMVRNLCSKYERPVSDVAVDSDVFECLNRESARYKDMFVSSADPKFQMCLRTVKRMMTGYLPDSVHGAVRFHRIDQSPDWALHIGYIAEIDDLTFYL